MKPPNSRHPQKFMDVFEVEPSRAQIACHGHVYATVTFTPPSMQVNELIMLKLLSNFKGKITLIVDTKTNLTSREKNLPSKDKS